MRGGGEVGGGQTERWAGGERQVRQVRGEEGDGNEARDRVGLRVVGAVG